MSGRNGKHSVAPLATDSWTTTKQDKVQARHVWTIEDFFQRLRSTPTRMMLRSVNFSLPVETPKGGILFHLGTYIKKCTHNTNHDNWFGIICKNCRSVGDVVVVDLNSTEAAERLSAVKFRISLLKADGSTWDNNPRSALKMFGKNEYIYVKNLEENEAELLPEGQLTLVCNLEAFTDRVIQGNTSRLLTQEEFSKAQDTRHKTQEGQTLSDYMDGVWTSGRYSDVEIQCDGRKFPCHKAVLSRSDVFLAMFSHEGLRENQLNQAVIKDIDGDTLEQMLKYLYTDKVDCDLQQLASSLVQAANKYNLPGLMGICEEALCNNINVENAADMLVTAFLHEASCLKTAAVNFVTVHMSEVAKAPGWETIKNNHPAIYIAVLENVIDTRMGSL